MAPPRKSSGPRSSSGRPPARGGARSGGGKRSGSEDRPVSASHSGAFGFSQSIRAPRENDKDRGASRGAPRGGDRGPKAGRGGAPSRGPMEKPKAMYGVVEISKKGVFIKPANRNQKFTIELDKKNLNNAMDGEIVFISRQEEKNPNQPHKPARLGDYAVRERLGSAQDVRNYSLLSLLEAGLQPHFPPKVVDSCYEFTVPELGKREDLRHLPLVTIDGEDARDFDDAVYARPADDGNGWYAIIAIADVAHYVTEGSLLDKEALRRGNSTYFPDRVVPMLPERLSNDLCSLRPHEDRACMHVHVWIDEKGQISDWNIGRGLMRSAARLTYNQVQKTLDGQSDDTTQPLLENIQNLYKVFCVLLRARMEREALDINATERKIIMDGEGGVAAVVPRERFEAHQLIEELMITANVVVATALEAKSAPCMYRVHDRPSALKVATLAEFVKPLGLKLPVQQSEIETGTFNTVLRKVVEMPDLMPVINDLVLRCQMQAVYTPENIGHFGLALERYAHFTSPIRRYADLVNHRALITAYDLGEDGLKPEDKNLMEEWAEQISQTERASMLAERACVDRFTAHFLQTQIGKEITGRISSVTSFGLFVSLLDGIGEALVPMRLLPQDFYDFIEEKQALVGQRSGRVYRLGGRVSLMITGIDPILGSITAQLMGGESADLAGFDAPTRGAPRAPREDRGGFGRDRESRPPRRDFGDRDRDRKGPSRGGDRKPRFDNDSRPPRRDDGGNYKSRDDDSRPRRFSRDDNDGPRPPYKGGRDAKPAFGSRKSYDDKPRAPRRDHEDDRAPRSYRSRDEGDSRPPRRDYGDRPAPRSRDGEDRPRRSYGDGQRPSRDNGSGERSYGSRGGEDRSRSYRPRDDGDSRPPRRDDYGDRSTPRSSDGEDRPRRSYGDGPKTYRSRDDGGDRGGKPSGRSGPPKSGGKPSYGKPSGGGAPKPRSNGPKNGGKFRK